MNYLENFVNGLEELTRYNKEFKKSNPNFSEIQKTLSEFSSQRNNEPYPDIRKIIHELAIQYVKNAPVGQVVNKCHSISHGFWEGFRNSELAKVFSLNITVGNIFYKNKNIYDLSKSKLKKIIRQGQVLSDTLDVHVWLTLNDLTVLDLTIIPTLVQQGLLPKEELTKSPVLVWHESELSNFSFQPLLVDNDFMHRVDCGIKIP